MSPNSDNQDTPTSFERVLDGVRLTPQERDMFDSLLSVSMFIKPEPMSRKQMHDELHDQDKDSSDENPYSTPPSSENQSSPPADLLDAPPGILEEFSDLDRAFKLWHNRS